MMQSASWSAPAVSRRSFVGVCLGAPIVAWAGPLLGEDTTSGFLRLSAHLTGFPEGELDPEYAVEIMEALLSTTKTEVFESLLAGRTGEQENEMARQIISAWYSGIHLGPQGLGTHTFEGALAWRALGYTKPPGFCATGSADWAAAPRP